MGCLDQLPINVPVPWGAGKVKVGVLCGVMQAVPVSHGLCHATVISITVFVCSTSFPAKGLLPLDFPNVLCAVAEVQPLGALPACQSPAASTAGWRQRSVKVWAEF